jgi:hypothetical protein
LKKNFFEIGREGYQKKRNFVLISKMCRSLDFCKREKKFTEKLNFRDLENLAKTRFSEKKSLGTS